MRDVIEESNIPFDEPITVTDVEPVVGTLARTTELKPTLKVNTREAELVRSDPEDTNGRLRATPQEAFNLMQEVDTQSYAWPVDPARLALVEYCSLPTWQPNIVTDHDPEDGTFAMMTLEHSSLRSNVTLSVRELYRYHDCTRSVAEICPLVPHTLAVFKFTDVPDFQMVAERAVPLLRQADV